MKHLRTIGIVAILLLAIAAPSQSMAQSWWEGFANAPQPNSFWDYLQRYPGLAGPLGQDPYQIYDPGWRSQHPEIQQYINNNPGWWNSIRSNGSQYYDERFNQFLSNHPGIARDLRRNPELIYDPRYRAQHPDLNEFLAGHRKIWRSIKNQQYAYSNRGGWGAYNNSNQWRDETWWKDNGDWDQNQWHDRAWWEQNNRNVAQQRHPNWVKQRQQPPRARKLQDAQDQSDKHGGSPGQGHGGDHDNN